MNPFLQQQEKSQVDYYVQLLQRMGSLSSLFADTVQPYLHYRVAENVFCKAFEATNQARSDTAADATKNGFGIGIKTFLNNRGHSFQKIAEFNKDRVLYRQLISEPEELIRVVSRLRNERIEFAKSLHGVTQMVYHCVVRAPNQFLIFEEEMDCVKEDAIKITSVKDNTIIFTDDLHEYNFNLSKSTLLKRFHTAHPLEFDVEILNDPYQFIMHYDAFSGIAPKRQNKGSVILPLYSIQGGRKIVPESSGLNTWNGKGRRRDPNEVYIPIPAWIHKTFPSFFPNRNHIFELILPNSGVLSAKVCQDGGKALMSNPNSALGKWLLNDVLKKEEGQLMTYQELENLDIDSVEITKIDEQTFEINFKKVGSYESFVELNKSF